MPCPKVMLAPFRLLKFNFSEKITKFWCNLPQGFDITLLLENLEAYYAKFLWPSQKSWILWKWTAKFLEPRGRVSWVTSIVLSERAKNQRGFTKAGIIYYISVFSCVKYVFAAKAKTQKWWVILEFMHRNCVLTFCINMERCDKKNQT